jgi:hypothetical protein
MGYFLENERDNYPDTGGIRTISHLQKRKEGFLSKNKSSDLASAQRR